jgi:hypothetical protein
VAEVEEVVLEVVKVIVRMPVRVIARVVVNCWIQGAVFALDLIMMPCLLPELINIRKVQLQFTAVT